MRHGAYAGIAFGPNGAGQQRLSVPTLAVVVLAHAGVWMALQSVGLVSQPEQAPPLVVELLTPASPAPTPLAPARPVPPPPRLVPPVQPSSPPARSLPTSVAVAPLLQARSSSSAELDTSVATVDKTSANANAKAVAPAPATAAGPAQPAEPLAAHATAAPAQPLLAPRFDAAYLDNPAPVYPPLSRRAREEGRVLLRVLVEASGQAAKLEVQGSSGFERLDRSALAAVARWKFVPARQGAEAVAAWVLVPLVFSLKD